MNVRRVLRFFFAICAMSFAWSSTPASASMILQAANNTTGNQIFSGVGVQFAVNSAVTVTDLGIFDSDQDGIAASPLAPLSAYLLTNIGNVVASITFDSLSPGALEAGTKYRFKAISPVILQPGTYVLAGYGWSAADPEHNSAISGDLETFNDGDGFLTYDQSLFGTGDDAGGTLPTTGVASNFFSAANMKFDVPEPSMACLFVIGGSVLLGRRRGVATAA